MVQLTILSTSMIDWRKLIIELKSRNDNSNVDCTIDLHDNFYAKYLYI